MQNRLIWAAGYSEEIDYTRSSLFDIYFYDLLFRSANGGDEISPPRDDGRAARTRPCRGWSTACRCRSSCGCRTAVPQHHPATKSIRIEGRDDGFTGFGPKALPFFEALKFHQSKAWFEENRGLYEADVLAPMVALVDDLTAAFASAEDPAPRRRQALHLPAQPRRPLRQGQEPLQDPRRRGDDPLRRQEGHRPPLHPHRPDRLLHRRRLLHAGGAGAGRVPEGDPRPARQGEGAARASSTRAAWRSAPSTSSPAIPRGFEALKDGPLDGMVRMKSLVVEEKLPRQAGHGPEARRRDRRLRRTGQAAPRLRLAGGGLSRLQGGRSGIYIVYPKGEFDVWQDQPMGQQRRRPPPEEVLEQAGLREGQRVDFRSRDGVVEVRKRRPSIEDLFAEYEQDYGSARTPPQPPQSRLRDQRLRPRTSA